MGRGDSGQRVLGEEGPSARRRRALRVLLVLLALVRLFLALLVLALVLALGVLALLVGSNSTPPSSRESSEKRPSGTW